MGCGLALDSHLTAHLPSQVRVKRAWESAASPPALRGSSLFKETGVVADQLGSGSQLEETGSFVFMSSLKHTFKKQQQQQYNKHIAILENISRCPLVPPPTVSSPCLSCIFPCPFMEMRVYPARKTVWCLALLSYHFLVNIFSSRSFLRLHNLPSRGCVTI